LALGLQTAWGFSLIGPLSASPGGQAWQIPTIGYGLAGDLGTPRNLAEEYRRTTPVMYYACDASFLDYFGSNGAVAIDQTFNILNGVLTNGVDSYDYTSQTSTNRFPFETAVENINAAALNMYDLKSALLIEMTEQLGLADSVRWTWTLTDRHAVEGDTNPCPANIEYIVVQYNFDPVTWQPSAYVDNTLWSYYIFENCTGNPEPEADAVETNASTPVNLPVTFGIPLGSFYTNLTWDDVGGLKYIYSTNNWNNEAPNPTSLLFNTNFNSLQLLFTSNYNALVSASSTNSPTALQALYPGLIVAPNPPSYFSNVVSPVIVSYFTNFIGQPADQPATLVTVTTYVTNIVQFYVNSFGNVVTNKFYPTTSYAMQTITVGPPIGWPSGTPFVTNVTLSSFQSNVVSGDFFIITNGACGPNFVQTIQTNVNVVTNTITAVTNVNGQMFAQNLISYFTNYAFGVNPCTLTTNGQGLYQGIGKMRFVKTTFDSLLGQFYQPITNQYTMVLVTNSQLVTQSFQRVVTTPDFLISASNIIVGPDAIATSFSYSRNLGFTPDIGYPLPGPGTINSSMTLYVNKIGNTFFVGPSGDTNIVLNQSYQIGSFVWGSINDLTATNLIVYPTNTDIQNLVYQSLIHITPPPPALPDATNGAAYSLTFTTTGGSFTPPDSWSLTPGGGGLPPGLGLSAAGAISGTPTQTGTFDNIIVQMNDSLGRSVRWGYSMTVH
jgi:hypothetical protein